MKIPSYGILQKEGVAMQEEGIWPLKQAEFIKRDPLQGVEATPVGFTFCILF